MFHSLNQLPNLTGHEPINGKGKTQSGYRTQNNSQKRGKVKQNYPSMERVESNLINNFVVAVSFYNNFNNSDY